MLTTSNLARRIYALLLSLYPSGFREAFAEEMRAVFTEAAVETRRRGIQAYVEMVVREIWGLLAGALSEHWQAFSQKEAAMSSTLEMNGGNGTAKIKLSGGSEPGSWKGALLAGLPHLLYPLSIEVPTLVQFLTSEDVRIYFLGNIFWVLVILMLVFGWRRKWPRWSASWVGYGSVMLFDFLINTAQTYYGSLLENEAVVLWLLITMAVFFWMAKRDWLSGLLVVLPVVPMFSTYISLDGVKGTVPEGLFFMAVGLLMMLVVMAIVRTGNLRAGVWLVLVTFVVINIPLAYATTYHSNRPVYFAYEPTVADMVGGFLISALIFVIFAAPLWFLVLWTKGRSWLAHNKAT